MSENNNSTVQKIPSNKASNIRLLELDLDGTIVDESNRIKDSVAQAIALVESRGVAIAIATGRRYQSSLPAYDFIGATQPLICLEGGLIRDRHTGVTHRHWPLELDELVQILNHTERLSLKRSEEHTSELQ